MIATPVDTEPVNLVCVLLDKIVRSRMQTRVTDFSMTKVGHADGSAVHSSLEARP